MTFLIKTPEYYDTADTKMIVIESGGIFEVIKILQNEQIKDWFDYLAGILHQRTVY